MSDEKDRLGDKFRDVEAARESEWARRRDQELLEKMRARASVALKCPKCGGPLAARVQNGVAMLACPAGDGAWLDSHALENLAKSSG
ncbi:MAG TPA: zf-TFIIB domain-containing protein [Candidatus Binataceae bacterium]|nr:zf-TFIIB domain-containing protein [Candidatus Binataceae bacterium]